MNLSVMSIDDSMCTSMFSVLSKNVISVLDLSPSVSELKVNYALCLFLNADDVTSL